MAYDTSLMTRDLRTRIKTELFHKKQPFDVHTQALKSSMCASKHNNN